MRMIKMILICSLVVLAATVFAQKQMPPEGGTPKNFVLPEKQVFTLDNGLTVTLVPYGTMPKVSVQLITRAGNLNEKEDEIWLADLTGDMLKEGTQNRTGLEISRQAAGMGGTVNIGTGMDQTNINGNVLTEFGPDLIELMGDIVMNPLFPESELDRLKANMLRNVSIQKSQPAPVANEKFRQVLYGDHPYARYFPTEEMVNSYDIQKVRDFYSANFGAGRTRLYVVGVFNEKSVEKAIRQTFGSWAKGEDAPILTPSPKSKRKVYIIDRPGVTQSVIQIGLPVIDPSHKDYVALQVTNTLLGGYFSSRITRNIREDKGYTYSPNSALTSNYRTAFWKQSAEVSTDVTGAAIKEIFFEIEGLQKEPPPADELDAVKNYSAGIFVLQNSAPNGIIGQLAFLDFHGLDAGYLNEYVKNIHAVTPEDVQRVMQTYLNDENMCIIIAGDKSKVRRQVRKYGEIE